MIFGKKKDWKKDIQNAYSLGPSRMIPVFYQPASMEAIDDCGKRLGVEFPDELKEFLLQTNGVNELVPTKSGNIESGYFLLSVEKILEINTDMRTYTSDYNMPLDCLLFFSGDGAGDYFGFAVVKGKVPHSRIYFWDHEDDSRRAIGFSLADFIENWLLGKLTV